MEKRKVNLEIALAYSEFLFFGEANSSYDWNKLIDMQKKDYWFEECHSHTVEYKEDLSEISGDKLHLQEIVNKLFIECNLDKKTPLLVYYDD